MTGRTLRAAACVIPAIVSLAGGARADEPRPVETPSKVEAGEKRPIPDSKPPLGFFSTPEDAFVDPRMMLSWATAPPRLFLATTVDIGFVYLRPRVTLGYGKPFTSFVGVDANAIAQSSALGAYGGVRLQVPHFDLRAGARYLSAFSHTYLETKSSYERIELETGGGDKSKTLTYEAEVDASVPVGPGEVVLRGSVSYVTGVPEGMSVFEETLHVIVTPPLVWRARGGYAFKFGARSQHSIGIVCDVLDVPKREDSLTVRAGPIIRLVLSRRVEVRGSFVMTVSSRDRIGLIGGDFTDLGVRYRWATE